MRAEPGRLQEAQPGRGSERPRPDEERQRDEAEPPGHEVGLRGREREPVREVEPGDGGGRNELAVVEEEHVLPEAGETAGRPEGVAQRVEHRPRPEGDHGRPAGRHRSRPRAEEAQQVLAGGPARPPGGPRAQDESAEPQGEGEAEEDDPPHPHRRREAHENARAEHAWPAHPRPVVAREDRRDRERVHGGEGSVLRVEEGVAVEGRGEDEEEEGEEAPGAAPEPPPHPQDGEEGREGEPQVREVAARPGLEGRGEHHELGHDLAEAAVLGDVEVVGDPGLVPEARVPAHEPLAPAVLHAGVPGDAVVEDGRQHHAGDQDEQDPGRPGPRGIGVLPPGPRQMTVPSWTTPPFGTITMPSRM